MSDYDQLLAFLDSQQYMVLAVSLDDGSPWATPVRIKQRNGRNFDWSSKIDTVHSRAIAVRPVVAISIFTPQSGSTSQYGFYATATAELLTEENGMGHYRASITKSWVNDETFVKREVSLD